jgi:peptidoglycan/xylan/chitin deacetylase (PgdA/CDA1 family)
MRLAENRLLLAYHSVSPTWTVDTSVTPERLREQLELFLSKGYRGVTLSEALRTDPRHKVMAATFDDAHISVYERARPILDDLGVPGTIFVPTDYPDSGRLMGWKGYDMWVGTPHEQELACMSWTQLREVADNGWEIGAHTCSHPFLTELPDADLARELRGSRQACEEHMERPCPTLAYPYSDWDGRVAAAAGAAGYTAAVTVNTGPWSAPLQLPRTGVYHYDTAPRLRIRALRRRFPRIDAMLKRLKGLDPNDPRL